MNGFDAQKWKLTKSEYRNVENGIYVIRAQDSKFSVLSEEDSDIRIDSLIMSRLRSLRSVMMEKDIIRSKMSVPENILM